MNKDQDCPEWEKRARELFKSRNLERVEDFIECARSLAMTAQISPPVVSSSKRVAVANALIKNLKFVLENEDLKNQFCLGDVLPGEIEENHLIKLLDTAECVRDLSRKRMSRLNERAFADQFARQYENFIGPINQGGGEGDFLDLLEWIWRDSTGDKRTLEQWRSLLRTGIDVV